MNANTEAILVKARKHVESRSTEGDGKVWGSFYLDSARPSGMNKHAFAGHLSALEASGLYRQMDGFFGEVLLVVSNS